MRRNVMLFVLLAVVLFVVGCAAHNHPLPAEAMQDVAGFWLGLWHGIIAPFTFLISLFVDSVRMYEVVNNGCWYDFGFALGAGMFVRGSCECRRHKS